MALRDFVGVSEFAEGQGCGVFGEFEPQEGQVGFLVEADDLGLDLFLVVEDTVDFNGLFGDVIVGDDQAVG